jgi:hypothetical protein
MMVGGNIMSPPTDSTVSEDGPAKPEIHSLHFDAFSSALRGVDRAAHHVVDFIVGRVGPNVGGEQQRQGLDVLIQEIARRRQWLSRGRRRRHQRRQRLYCERFLVERRVVLDDLREPVIPVLVERLGGRHGLGRRRRVRRGAHLGTGLAALRLETALVHIRADAVLFAEAVELAVGLARARVRADLAGVLALPFWQRIGRVNARASEPRERHGRSGARGRVVVRIHKEERHGDLHPRDRERR